MELNRYLDSTYLKTATQANISPKESEQKVVDLVKEAITHDFALVMIRPQYITLAKALITQGKSKVKIGTVIGFHKGTNTIEEKLAEAKEAIKNGADELDFVINYSAFMKGNIELVKNEILLGTRLCLANHKVAKWIIEIAALTKEQIIEITQLIKKVVVANFPGHSHKEVFVKSSTGFFKTEEGKPSGATLQAMELILAHARPLSVKAAGGVKSYNDAMDMIRLGVDRIGTSSALKIIQDKTVTEKY